MAFWLPKTVTCGGFLLYFCDLHVGSITSLEGEDSKWPELASFIFFPWHVNHPSSYSDPKWYASVLEKVQHQLSEGILCLCWRLSAPPGPEELQPGLFPAQAEL